MENIVLITGATAGIGRATAIKFAENNYNLIITGRRQERLDALKVELIKKFAVKVETLCFDIRDKQAVRVGFQSLPDSLKNISVLVNNAGLSQDLTPIQDGTIEDFETMIDTNVKGLLYISKEVMPIMIKNKDGHIINLGSIAAKETYANNNGYCPSKFAVDSLTKTMRIDLLKYNIRVTAVHPGAVNTEFSTVRFKGDIQRADAVYKGFTPLIAEDVADSIFYCATLPKHININELIIMPMAQANAGIIHRVE
ncbi:MAG: SDR family NAD(P)-dependent oxidoreductase [Bacteroidota bacterium]